jgi:hypothetical protein
MKKSILFAAIIFTLLFNTSCGNFEDMFSSKSNVEDMFAPYYHPNADSTKVGHFYKNISSKNNTYLTWNDVTNNMEIKQNYKEEYTYNGKKGLAIIVSVWYFDNEENAINKFKTLSGKESISEFGNYSKMRIYDSAVRDGNLYELEISFIVDNRVFSIRTNSFDCPNFKKKKQQFIDLATILYANAKTNTFYSSNANSNAENNQSNASQSLPKTTPKIGRYIYSCENKCFIDLLPNNKFKAYYEECEVEEFVNGNYSFDNISKLLKFDWIWSSGNKASTEYTFENNRIIPTNNFTFLHCINCAENSYQLTIQ